MKTISLIFITVLLLGCSHKVDYVLDGDTIILENGKTVRLYGIDAPETEQPYGEKSKEFLKSLLVNEKVRTVKRDVDQYGRVVAIVILRGHNINELMIKNGYAWVYDQYCNRTNWIILEDKAKQNNLGLWKQDNPVKPWKFRHQNQ